MLTRFLNVKAEKGSDGQPVFRLTDETVDRHETIIKMDGWEVSNFLNNPIMFYQHFSFTGNPDHALGYWNVDVRSDAIYGIPNFEPADLNPLADKIKRKIEFGTISMVSVGFNPIEWSFGDRSMGENPEILYFRKSELLEVSIVHIGSNRNAHNKDGEGYLTSQSIADFVKMAKDDKPIDEMHDFIERETPKQLDEITTLYLRTL
jgi:HK97 family phage prohead protease